MSRMRIWVLGLVALMATSSTALAQGTGTIQGVVRGEAGVPLPDATIAVVDTRQGALTRADGRYSITGVPAGTHRVRVNRLGYGAREQSVTVAAGQTATADFTITAVAVTLDRIVTIGYGAASQRELTGSVTSISTQDIATLPVPRIDQAISGLASGVQVQTTNAQPGSQMRIRIRGGNSMQGNNEPLVVVDGVIGGDMNQISPNDIESVEILKDASATSIYGARAANGVILLTTKRGQPGKVRFEYNGYTGMQQASKMIDLLNADEFALMYMRNQQGREGGLVFDTLTSMPSTDWQDVVYRTAPMTNHEVRMSGSNGGTGIMLSATLFDQQGIVIGSAFKRGSLRFNLDQDLGSKIKVGTRLMMSRSVGDEVRVNDGYGSAGGPITMMALRFAPTIPVRDSLGNYSGPLLPGQTMDNPLAIAELRDDKNTNDYLLSNFFGEYRPIESVTFRSTFGYTTGATLSQRYLSRQLRQVLNLGQANVDNSKRTTWLSENTATLKRTFWDNHDVTLLAGFTAQQTRRNASNQQGQGFATDQLGYRRLNLAELITGSTSSSQDRLMSGLGRLNYNLLGRYLFTATLRTDGSSKFAENNKWATFPSFAFAWRASDEPFFKPLLGTVSELKFRSSWGKTGSEAIGAYQSLAAWSVGAPYVINKTRLNNGAKPARNANPNLRWETTEQTDIGVDLGLFNDRVSLTVDAYDKKTHDLLYDKQVPYYTGFEDYTTNVGKIGNKGLELALDTRNLVGPVELRLGGNLSFNRSKVLDLGGDKEFFRDGVNGSLPRFRPAAVIRVGEPLGNFYGWVWDGIFQTDAEAAASGQAGARAGSMKLRDINADGVVNQLDLTILGNAQPKYMFAQTGTLGYKAVSLSYILRGVQDFQVVNLNRQGMSTAGGTTNQLREVLNYWTPENKSQTQTGIGIGPYDGMTSRWVEDGSFVRLQNVTLSFNVPQRLTSRFNMGTLRLYAAGQNLHTWTKYTWYDPEVSSRGTNDLELGWDDSSYPGVRTFTLGLNVGF